MNLSTLNRRHKVGLFLVLVATGLSLFFEVSAKQTTGIVLLGLAATWLLGCISLRLLWLLSSLLGCFVGSLVVGMPVVDDWKSFQESVQSYDRAVADLREAVTKARSLHVVKSEPLPPLPPGYKLVPPRASSSPPIDFSAIGGKKVAPPSGDWFAQNAPPQTSAPSKIDWSEYDGTRAEVYYDALAKKWQKREISSCPDNVPLDSSLTGYCVLSGLIVQGFRPEMCIGTIADNGDCHTVGPRWAVGSTTQLCPYGLAIDAEGKCPAWDVFDEQAAKKKLRDFRERNNKFDRDKFMAERQPPPQGKIQNTPQSDLSTRPVPASQTRARGQYTAADIDMTVEIPATTQNWERPDPSFLPPGAQLVSGVIVTRLSFPPPVGEEELMSSFQNQLLQPRPKFTVWASLISHRLSSLLGLALLAAGLFNLGWFSRSIPRVERGHT